MTAARERHLKSISLRLDLAEPKRFEHHHPTGNSLRVLRAVYAGRPSQASIVTAAYGSGKSLATGAALLLARNDRAARPALRTIAERIGPEHRADRRVIEERLAGRGRGVAIALEGHCGDLRAALHAAAKPQLPGLRRNASLPRLLASMLEHAARAKLDPVAIVWDEFGKHIEELARLGRLDSMLEIQQLAEWAARQEAPRATLTLLLHQNFINYTANVSQSASNSLRKIEGRFEAIRFVEDSKEIHRLIASIVDGRHGLLVKPAARELRRQAKELRALGLFAGHATDAELAATLAQAAPLHPLALHALPRVAARLAQNERTVFSFVYGAGLDRPTGMLELYSFFAPAMQTDSGIGGTHKRWLETEAALSKAANDAEREVIAAAALLTIGTGGERARLGRRLLELAGHDGKRAAARAIDALARRQLLLYRKRSDDVAVSHGVDLDLSGALREEKTRLDAGFDAIAALNEEHPAPAWHPHIHNIKRRIRRFFASHCVAAAELLRQGEKHPLLQPQRGEDGRIIYCLGPRGGADAKLAKLAAKLSKDEPRLVFAVPAEEHDLKDLLLEVKALRRLLANPKLVDEDPYVKPELQSMLDAALGDLRRTLARALQPGDGNAWYLAGQELSCADEEELARRLSKLCTDTLYPQTPVLNLETLVKRQVSSPMRNARKRLILRVLEQSGAPDLGLEASSGTAYASIYRSLLKDKVYRDGQWLRPSQIRDNKGLRRVWEAFADFFATPGRGKRVEELVYGLVARPYGLREGVIPLYFAAGLMAFGRCLAIKDAAGAYLPDILASDIDAICQRPADYAVDVYEPQPAYLSALIEAFHGEPKETSDLLRQFHDALSSWREQLPEGALKSRPKDPRLRRFRDLVARAADPAKLAFEQLPELAGGTDAKSVRDILDYRGLSGLQMAQGAAV